MPVETYAEMYAGTYAEMYAGRFVLARRPVRPDRWARDGRAGGA
ncbi:hypothetical protein [Streptomyces leeuwenhoekii]|nr:hypothetical protein [Streptomyces leeuwenhoekii]